MLHSLYIVAVYLAFVVMGAVAPFVFSLGYVWVDTFTPQYVAPVLESFPVSLVMAVLAIGGYLAMDRRSPPRRNVTVILTVLLAIWVTLSTSLWAVVPAAAWGKWNYAFKTVLFSAFVPYVFRSRIQIEAFLQIYVFSCVIYFLPAGIKTLISGGGYGFALSVVAGNSGLSEGSTLAAVSLMLIPIILFLRGHTKLLPRSWVTSAMYYGLVVGALASAIGTYERTAVVGLAVMAVGLWLCAKRKILFGIVGLAAAAGAGLLLSHSWDQRISTITDYGQESSALGRILVWEWTLGFVATHPLGGGFNSFIVDVITIPANLLSPAKTVYGKAFHSIYFEMLGEQGWVGIGLFFGLIANTFATLRRVARRSRGVADLAWCRSLAFTLAISLATLLTCGAFIGIAFQPMLYYIFAISTSLGQFVRRADAEQAVPAHETLRWTGRASVAAAATRQAFQPRLG